MMRRAFSDEKRWLRRSRGFSVFSAELKFAPIARRLGWRPEFEWSRLQAWIDRHQDKIGRL